MKTDATGLDIVNPKRDQRRGYGRQSWYPFYAGFSLRFAETLLSSIHLQPNALVVDPWNGTGTSSLAAANLGNLGRGFDLNPVMVVAARGKLLDSNDVLAIKDALRPLLRRPRPVARVYEDDPLAVWFSDSCVLEIRAIQSAFHRALNYVCPNGNGHSLVRIPKTVSFFYVAMFRTVRHFLRPFLSSNPTWIKKPRAPNERIQFSKGDAVELFASVCSRMLSEASPIPPSTAFSRSRADIASADSLPLRSGSVDLVLTSPPYCTRIDYAVATMPELAILGYGGERFAQLRRALTGTLTVNGDTPCISAKWGPTCIRFLKTLRTHPSKASGTYYLKTHLQYFASIENSLAEIHRVMRSGSQCVLVVQDSYYKEVRNDLPTIFTEMAKLKGLRLARKQDFRLSRVMVRINPRTKKYRQRPTAIESVLCFSKL
jgi:DNA modification methylase